MAADEHGIRTVASIPGKLTMLDHVLLAASTSSTDDQVRGLAEWIRTAYLSPVRSGCLEAGVDTRGMAGRGTSPTIVGRGAELAVLAEAVASVQAGRPRIVLVAGDAGIGKTRLVTETCARAERDGVLCAVGGCVQLGTASLAYAPLIQALRGVRHRVGEHAFTDVLGPAAATVGVLLGITEGAGGEPDQVFEQLLGVLGRLADRQPTLLVFEDLHWADASTRDVVTFLARNLREVPVGLVLTYRGDELHRRHPWLPVLADLHRDPLVERITLTGLGRPDMALLVDQIGADGRDASVEELLRRTGGNPFYVEELVAAGGLGQRVPATLAEVILARLHDLPEPTPTVLHQAAVLGEAIHDQWLADLTDRPLAEVTEALREAVSRHLLVADGAGCRFRHALVREALYDDLLPGERERWHAAAARLLQDKPPHIPEHVRQTLLAYHAHAAADVPTAFAASVQAGLESERVFALSAAAVQYERALSLWEGVIDPVGTAGMIQAELLVRAAEALLFGSFSERALTLADAAIVVLPVDLGAEQRAELLVRIANINNTLQRGQRAVAGYEQAVALLADRPPSREKARALSSLGGIRRFRGRARDAEPVLREAIAVAEGVGANAIIAQTLCTLGGVHVDKGRAEEGLSALRRSLELSREYGSAKDVCRIYVNLTDALTLCAGYEEAAYLAREGSDYATRAGQTFYAVAISGNRIEALFRLGRWLDAEQVEAQFTSHLSEHSWLHGSWIDVLLGQGRLPEARAVVTELLAAAADVGDVQFAGDGLLRAGEFAELENRWDEARDLLAQGLAVCRETDDQRCSARGYASAIRVERRRIESSAGQRATARDVARAREVADQLVLQARELVVRGAAKDIKLLPEPAAWLQTAEAEHATAWGHDTAQLWADVADAWLRVGQPYPKAVAQYREADALLRQHGDRDRACRCCAAALEVAEQLHAAPLMTEIRQLAQRARLNLEPTPAKPERPTGLEITAREAEVLTLLTTGRTNREIAKVLFISEKTASVHVSNLLRKLGVGARVEAAAIAQRLGLADNDPRRNGQPPAET
jgi:DNA-binding CsgD family transcriptional regulator/tetratricopeptide (TPR) repeat protein